MESRHYIGIAIIVVGVVLQPIGWMYSTIVAVVSFILIAIGAFIFITQKVLEKMEEKEFGSANRGGPDLPGDVHGSSGWERGGRSDAWESSSHESGGHDGGD